MNSSNAAWRGRLGIGKTRLLYRRNSLAEDYGQELFSPPQAKNETIGDNAMMSHMKTLMQAIICSRGDPKYWNRTMNCWYLLFTTWESYKTRTFSLISQPNSHDPKAHIYLPDFDWARSNNYISQWKLIHQRSQ